SRVRAVDRRCARVGEAKSSCGDGSDHVEDEERAHAVVAEALPHLGEEQRRETAWMTEEPAIDVGSGSSRNAHRGAVYSIEMRQVLVLALAAVAACAPHGKPQTAPTTCRTPAPTGAPVPVPA